LEKKGPAAQVCRPVMDMHACNACNGRKLLTAISERLSSGDKKAKLRLLYKLSKQHHQHAVAEMVPVVIIVIWSQLIQN
ncbi:hypothetical protein T4B_9538, partial [Trichinella pseudospiralis]